MTTTTAPAADLTAGTTVILEDGSRHTVATVEESVWEGHCVLTFTDGCHMYAVRDDTVFPIA